MSHHVVVTTHIQRLIRNGLELAEAVDGIEAGFSIPTTLRMTSDRASVEASLEKAIADLRHAAEELEAERLSCLGWRQV